MLKRYESGLWVPATVALRGDTGIAGNTGATGDTGDTGPTGYTASDAAKVAVTTFKCQNVDEFFNGNFGGNPIVDGRLYLMAMYLPVASSITGMRLCVGTAGNFTADNNNKVGLYTSNGTTLTKVAESANDSTIWSTASDFKSVPFTAPYAASVGLLYGAFLYNSSAQTSAPELYGMQISSAVRTAIQLAAKTNNEFRMGYLASQTDLPSSITMSAVTTGAELPFIGCY